MAKAEKCSKCGSTAIVPRAMVADRNQNGEYDLRLRVDAQPLSDGFQARDAFSSARVRVFLVRVRRVLRG